MAHLWARWVRNPRRLGEPHRFRAGGRIGSGAQKRAELLRNSCFLGDPQKGGIEMAHVGPGQKGLKGRSLRGVLNKKKSRPLRTPLLHGMCTPCTVHHNMQYAHAMILKRQKRKFTHRIKGSTAKLNFEQAILSPAGSGRRHRSRAHLGASGRPSVPQAVDIIQTIFRVL